MPEGPFKPGDKLPARWANRVDAAAAAYHSQHALGNSKGSKPAAPVDRSTVKIKNLTGSDLLRGHYVQLGEFELDAKDPRKLWFAGNLYDEESNQRIGIVTNAVKEGSRVDAVLVGVAVAVVDVKDAEHRYAKPVDGEHVLESADSGPVEILDTVSTTGEQECVVLLGAGGGGSANVAFWAIAGVSDSATSPGGLYKVDKLISVLDSPSGWLVLQGDDPSDESGELECRDTWGEQPLVGDIVMITKALGETYAQTIRKNCF